jgi:hypothetical protein
MCRHSVKEMDALSDFIGIMAKARLRRLGMMKSNMRPARSI